MPGMEDEIDPLKRLDHLGWWLRTHGWDVGVCDQANLHTEVESLQLWSVSQASQGSATASWSHQKWNPTCSASWRSMSRSAVTIPCLLLPRGEAVGATADDEPQLFGPSDHFYSDTAGWVAEFHGAIDVKADEKSQLSSSSRLPSANMASIEAISVMRSEIIR